MNKKREKLTGKELIPDGRPVVQNFGDTSRSPGVFPDETKNITGLLPTTFEGTGPD
ncbi:MAG: hypothetical protein WD578_06810 [Bacteroidales bacterium]